MLQPAQDSKQYTFIHRYYVSSVKDPRSEDEKGPNVTYTQKNKLVYLISVIQPAWQLFSLHLIKSTTFIALFRNGHAQRGQTQLSPGQGEQTRAAARLHQQPMFRAPGTQQQLHETQHNSFNSAPATAQSGLHGAGLMHHTVTVWGALSYKSVTHKLSRSSLKKILSFKGSRRPTFLS